MDGGVKKGFVSVDASSLGTVCAVAVSVIVAGEDADADADVDVGVLAGVGASFAVSCAFAASEC